MDSVASSPARGDTSGAVLGKGCRCIPVLRLAPLEKTSRRCVQVHEVLSFTLVRCVSDECLCGNRDRIFCRDQWVKFFMLAGHRSVGWLHVHPCTDGLPLEEGARGAVFVHVKVDFFDRCVS